MNDAPWGALLPDQVADCMTFDRHDPNWHYRVADRVSMPARQAEGVAYLWNTLAQHNLALLADEVGTGKTFQALGVMTMLWRMNPAARVLVMAPNRDICKHWMREYRAFTDGHMRAPSRCLRHTPYYFDRLEALADEVDGGPGQLFFTTIYALSGLVPDKSGDVLAQAEAAARDLHKRMAPDGKPGFDLIVIDEAHYFRNAHAHSQRSRAAAAFFGEEGQRLARKALLMTATPSHSSLQNVPNILGYFMDRLPQGASVSPVELLQTYALRRLRLMKGSGGYHNKYSYRHERAVPASFENDPEAEMFFALYQKKLVQQQGQQGHQRRYLYGYLEGFESVHQSENRPAAQAVNGGAETSTHAFEGAPDTQILQALAQAHCEAFGSPPEHPKYNALVQQCVPLALFDGDNVIHEHKHLVFVRRIPSVREMTQRVNEAYDRVMAQQIVSAWGFEKPKQMLAAWEAKRWSRGYLSAQLRKQGHQQFAEEEAGDDLDTADLAPETSEAEHLNSRIADLFVVRKTGRAQDRTTDCSNFSQRLRKPERIFSLLLEPALDYRERNYTSYTRKLVGERERDDYAGPALEARRALHTPKANGAGPGPRVLQYQRPMPTLWGLMYPLLPEASRARLDGWLARPDGWKIAENFAHYLRTGYLFASPVIIELYREFTQFIRKGSTADAQQRYLAFIEWLKPRLEGSLALSYFSAALDTFEQMCEKITDHALSDWSKGWRALVSLHSPAWFASGESHDRQRLILGFNSPFYPNVLVATSVFQEGVNLHLQCSKVHHYGIAWTPGDNEQRVGRVDRLFGLVNRQLESEGAAELAIHYPYLTRSFDQEQLAAFVTLKYEMETRMDACRLVQFNDEVDIRTAQDGWEQYLRRPDPAHRIEDPYPASFALGEK